MPKPLLFTLYETTYHWARQVPASPAGDLEASSPTLSNSVRNSSSLAGLCGKGLANVITALTWVVQRDISLVGESLESECRGCR